jgi:RimJ/RimL family protein N-acetyltransferase
MNPACVTCSTLSRGRPCIIVSCRTWPGCRGGRFRTSFTSIIGTLPEAYGDQIIAVGRYYLDPGTNRAEVAFIVRDSWQNRGIGTSLLKYLATIARGQGIAGFTAEVLADNRAMLSVLRKSGFRLRSRLDGRVHSIELDFE